jgi:hypothetical protein
MLLFQKLMPCYEMDGAPGSAEPLGPQSTPPVSGPAGDGQPQPSGDVTQIAEDMGIPLGSYPEQVRPAIVERLKQLEPKVNEILQRSAPWRDLGQKIGVSSPEEVIALAEKARQAEVLQRVVDSLAANRQAPQPQQADDIPPELRDNPYFADPDARAAIEHLADRKVTALKAEIEAMKARSFAEWAEGTIASYVKDNPHLSLTPEQLRKACLDNRIVPDSPTKLAQAALAALGPEEYAKRLVTKTQADLAARVAATTPSPVVTPGAPTATPPGNEPDLTNPRAFADYLIASFPRNP